MSKGYYKVFHFDFTSTSKKLLDFIDIQTVSGNRYSSNIKLVGYDLHDNTVTKMETSKIYLSRYNNDYNGYFEVNVGSNSDNTPVLFWLTDPNKYIAFLSKYWYGGGNHYHHFSELHIIPNDDNYNTKVIQLPSDAYYMTSGS